MRVRVLIDHLMHDGVCVAAGDVIEVADEQVAALVALGAVEPLPVDDAAAEAAPARRTRR